MFFIFQEDRMNLMPTLNLPACQLRIRKNETNYDVYDSIRKKYVKLTPEEWVRQHFMAFLVQDLHFPASHIAVEFPLKVNRLNKRCDIVVFGSTGKALVIVECKQPETALNQAVFDQIARYNLTLNVPYLIVTNGLMHVSCQMDYETESYRFLEGFPEYL